MSTQAEVPTTEPEWASLLRDKAVYYARTWRIGEPQVKGALHDIFSMLSLYNIGPYVAEEQAANLADVTAQRDRYRAALTEAQRVLGPLEDPPVHRRRREDPVGPGRRARRTVGVVVRGEGPDPVLLLTRPRGSGRGGPECVGAGDAMLMPLDSGNARLAVEAVRYAAMGAER